MTLQLFLTVIGYVAMGLALACLIAVGVAVTIMLVLEIIENKF